MSVLATNPIPQFTLPMTEATTRQVTAWQVKHFYFREALNARGWLEFFGPDGPAFSAPETEGRDQYHYYLAVRDPAGNLVLAAYYRVCLITDTTQASGATRVLYLGCDSKHAPQLTLNRGHFLWRKALDILFARLMETASSRWVSKILIWDMPELDDEIEGVMWRAGYVADKTLGEGHQCYLHFCD